MTPYENEGLDPIYNLLFCDDLEPFRNASVDSSVGPWSVLLNESASIEELEQLINDPNLESRFKILAVNDLLRRGEVLEGRRLFAVIVEVGLDEGLDVLAAYEDGSARYINHAGSLIVWDTNSPESDAMINDLFRAARAVVEQIGPWDGERLPPPPVGNVRLTFLVSDGLYFGEGQFGVLANDPMGGPVISGAARLMEFLIGKSLAQSE